MPIETADDLAVFFDADEFGVSAVYTPVGGDPFPIVAIREQGTKPSGDDYRVMVDVNELLIRCDQVRQPARGDFVKVADELFKINGAPVLDRFGALWTCPVEPA